MFSKIAYVVVAVKDLDEGIARYEKTFGIKATNIGEPSGAGYKNALFPLEEGRLELVAPTNDTGPVGRRVAAAGEGVYMITLAVDDLAAQVKELRDKGIRLIGDPGPGQPIQGQVFIHPSETKGVLTQLVQRS